MASSSSAFDSSAESMAVMPFMLFSVSILFKLAMNNVKHGKKAEKKEPATSSITPLLVNELNPCDSPPKGLGFGSEDPVVKYYVKSIEKAEWNEVPEKVDDKDLNTPDQWVHRHPDLIRLTGRHPFNCEPPLSKLMSKGYITPHSLHYVRTHGATPRIKFSEHKVYVGGEAPRPLVLTMADIMALPKRSIPVTLVCCGNRRKEQNMIKQTIGFNWGAAGVSTGVWTGARLVDVLKLAGIDTWEAGKHIRFASQSELGGDKLPGGAYGTSGKNNLLYFTTMYALNRSSYLPLVPLQKALDRASDILIAYMYNGEMLSVDHGFPVRIIIPGYIGGRMIKWLTNIDLMSTESQDYYHFHDNRVLPPHVDAEMAKAEGWWFKSEYICNDLSVNSAIAYPAHDEFLPVVSSSEEKYTMKGYAYTGGGRRITRVEISLDSGANWQLSKIILTEKPTEYGKYWTWIFWEFELPARDLIGKREIVLRAWDEGHNTQPVN